LKYASLLIAVLVGQSLLADPADLQLLRQELRVSAPPEQYPDGAEYKLFADLCTDLLCFKIVAVRFDSSGEEVIRLAVFSQNSHYIGSYTGLKVMPTRVVGSVLHFPMSAGGNRIQFRPTGPPTEIQIKNEIHTFQRSR
jgi:hypothetical protein